MIRPSGVHTPFYKHPSEEIMSGSYKDILYELGANAVRITINRPEVYNAFRVQTVEELIDAFVRANEEKSVNAVVLTGAGEKAFCTGGDQKSHLSEDGLYGPRGTVGLPIEELQTAIRDLRKVSIARVQGFAIGGGNVFATLCDLTIASEKAIFGQVGPKVGSVDPGWGTALLARHVGEKRAREIWFLCRRYTAAQAYEMGLVNKVVPHDQLDSEVEAWVAEINELSPTAIAIAKRSFNADSENIRGISFMGVQAVKHYYMSDESKEGVRAFNEKRKPDFKKYL
jgi:2-ketocyclohexanecarboxyl-CoA hydrolase